MGSGGSTTDANASTFANSTFTNPTFANQAKRPTNKNGTPRSVLKAVDSFGNSSFDSTLDSPIVNPGLLSKFSFLLKGQNETTPIKETLPFDN
jgi:hypothetical protein